MRPSYDARVVDVQGTSEFAPPKYLVIPSQPAVLVVFAVPTRTFCFYLLRSHCMTQRSSADAMRMLLSQQSSRRFWQHEFTCPLDNKKGLLGFRSGKKLSFPLRRVPVFNQILDACIREHHERCRPFQEDVRANRNIGATGRWPEYMNKRINK